MAIDGHNKRRRHRTPFRPNQICTAMPRQKKMSNRPCKSKHKEIFKKWHSDSRRSKKRSNKFLPKEWKPFLKPRVTNGTWRIITSHSSESNKRPRNAVDVPNGFCQPCWWLFEPVNYRNRYLSQQFTEILSSALPGLSFIWNHDFMSIDLHNSLWETDPFHSLWHISIHFIWKVLETTVEQASSDGFTIGQLNQTQREKWRDWKGAKISINW